MATGPDPTGGSLSLDLTDSQGVAWKVRLGDLTADDGLTFRRLTGLPLLTAFTGSRHGDLDLLTAVVWLHRRKREPELQWEEFARSFTYDDVVFAPRRQPEPPTDTDDGGGS